LARAYVEVGRAGDAQALLERALGTHPEDSDAHLLVARLRFGAGDHAGAQQHYEAVALQNPFNPEVHAALAKLYETLGQASKAEQARRFLQLAQKPRPSRTYELPAPPAGNARLRVVTPRWTQVRIAARPPQAAPAWDVPVEAGTVTVEYLRPAGDSVSKSVAVAAGATAVVVFE
jgi:tetratricopeptide (TPR) repeat protein